MGSLLAGLVAGRASVFVGYARKWLEKLEIVELIVYKKRPRPLQVSIVLSRSLVNWN